MFYNVMRVIFMDYRSSKGSILHKVQREKSEEIARMGGVNIYEFKGNISWLPDWIGKLKELDVFGQ